ncbi:Electron transport complex protein RnfG [gamma proteobacterium IMCC1989]|nr:Electron transport complex protein RnfG [gamma proteobacterium IMCC1989]
MKMPVSIGKNSLLLLLFALVTAGILATTYEGTKEKISIEERKAAQKALLEIIPQSRFDNDILLDTITLPESARDALGKISGENIYVARKNNSIVAVIVPAVAPDGYNGDIKLITGVNTDGTIAGVRVLTHKETPGLGDKIDIKKNQWITSFFGRSLQNTSDDNWNVKKNGGEFDQFTGATITPRAVVKQVHKILQFVEEHQKSLFTQAKLNNVDETPNNAEKANKQ